MDETRRFKLWVLVGVLFLLSGYASCVETKYLIWGKTTNAEVIDARKTVSNSGRRIVDVLEVRYTFKEEDGTVRKESFTQSLNKPAPSGGALPIEYIPGAPGKSRMQGKRNYLFVVIFAIMSGALIVLTVKIMRQAYDY
ncbi:MAG TPA: DUF3592 domain-containing protein [Phycisphaerae bacterium]|nr:DUF3592 domain-containing protein [Phycisphaerales bacterium]HRX84801.1 DUF3592 domain-containing protein [Phycisphaerae bacterium]